VAANLKTSAFLFFLFGTLCGTSFGDEIMDRRISEAVRSFFDLDSISVEVEIRRNRLETARMQYDSLEIVPLTRSEPRGLFSVRVNLYNDGRLIEKGQVRTRISYYDSVLVTTDKIRRQDEITSEQCRTEWREVTFLTDKPLSDVSRLSGLRAKRSIGKGQILTSGMVEAVPPVVYGQEVMITYATSLVEITVLGTALEKGYVGDIIKVKNNQSKKIIKGAVVEGGKVQVLSH